MMKKGYNYPIEIKIALASKNIQLVWHYHYTTILKKYK